MVDYIGNSKKKATAVVIANGGTTSGEIDLSSIDIVGFYLPAAFTGTAITFTAAYESGGTFIAVKDGAGNSISKTVAQGQYIKLDPADFAGVLYLKLVSGSAEAAERTVRVALREMQ